MTQVKNRSGVTLSPIFLVIMVILLPLLGFLVGSKSTMQFSKKTYTNTNTIVQTPTPVYEAPTPVHETLENRVNESKSLGFRILSPKEGEILCRWNYYPIKWEAPLNVEVVDLYIRQAGAPPSGTYDLGTFPSNYKNGTFSWRVGFTKGILWKPEEGTKELLSRPGYQIQISSPNKEYIDFSGKFTITDCPKR